MRGLLIALCGSGDGETGSGEGGCGRRGGKRPKESAFHDDASTVPFSRIRRSPLDTDRESMFLPPSRSRAPYACEPHG